MPRPGPVILLLTIVVLPACHGGLPRRAAAATGSRAGTPAARRTLQDASDRTVAALERDLSSLMLQTADAAWPAGKAAPGTVHLVATRDVRIDPVDAVEYWPTTAPLEPVPADPFRRADAMELERQDLPGALEVSRRLASSPGDASRAGALMRRARSPENWAVETKHWASTPRSHGSHRSRSTACPPTCRPAKPAACSSRNNRAPTIFVARRITGARTGKWTMAAGSSRP